MNDRRIDLLELRLIGKGTASVTKSPIFDSMENDSAHNDKISRNIPKKEGLFVTERKQSGSNSSVVAMAAEPPSNLKSDDLENLFQESKSELKRMSDKYDECRKALERALRENIHHEQKNRRRKIEKNNIRLGEVVSVRKGVKFSDEWQWGKRFVKLDTRIKKNHKKRDKLEKRKRNLTKVFKAIASGSYEVGNAEWLSKNSESDLRAIHNELDAVRLQISMLKKEETDINFNFGAINNARARHVQLLKRVSAEESSEYKAGMMLNNNKYMLTNIVGKGGFSTVFKAFDFERHTFVACKLHQISPEWSEKHVNNYVKHVMREFEIHRNLSHPNIVAVYDIFEEGSSMYVSVMEFCETDLDMRLKMQKRICERDAKVVISQVLSALKYMNEFKTPIIHYDLKPANILFPDVDSWSVKLTDFGLSKIMPKSIAEGDMSGMELTTQGAGTYWYLPPECFVMGKCPPKISSKVDTWAVGVIYFQMLYGFRPFGDDMNQSDILKDKVMLKAKEVSFPSKPIVSTDCKKFLMKSLAYSKDERPDPCALALDPYIYCKKSCVPDRTNSPITPTNRQIGAVIVKDNSSSY